MLNSLQTTGALVTINAHRREGEEEEEEEEEDELNQRETPLGLDPTATPSYVQHLAAFQTQLLKVEESCRQSHKL